MVLAFRLLALALLTATAAAGSSSRKHQIGTVAGVQMNGTHAGAGADAELAAEVIQRQTYTFPSEYELIECGLTIRFSNGLGLGPVPVSLRRDEPTETTSEGVRAFCGEECTWQTASYQCEQPISTGDSNTSLVWDAGEAAYVADPELLEYTFEPTPR